MTGPARPVRTRRAVLKRIGRWVLTAVTLALLVAFAFTVDWTATWGALRRASPLLIAAAALINLVSLAAKGAIWWVFLRPVGNVSLWLCIRATVAGAAVNNFVVAYGGDAARVVIVARAMRTRSPAPLAALALERVFDAAGYVVLLVIAAFLLPLPAMIERWRTPALVLLLLMAGFFALRLRRPPSAADVAEELDGTASLAGRARSYLRRFWRNMATVTTAERLAWAMALSMVSWVAQVATYHIAARAAAYPISVAGTVAALLAVNLSFLLRVTPGSVGIFQLVYATVAASFGLSRAAGIGVAVIIQAVQVIPTTILGGLLTPGMLFGRDRQRLRDEAEAELRREEVQLEAATERQP